MNPFELGGPEFLTFYFLYGLVVLVLLVLFGHAGEPEDTPRVGLTDPYLIAYLRGGRDEALRVAAMSLINRGLLTVHGSRLATRAAGDVQRATDELEKAVLQRFAHGPAEAASLFGDEHTGRAADELGRALQRLGLVPDETTTRNQSRRLLLAWAALWVVALIKIGIAVNRDRPIGFLLLMAGGFTVATVWIYAPQRTRRGEVLLADLRTLFAHLKERADQLRPKKNAGEATLLAAVFGLAMLPEAGWLHLRNRHSKATSSAGGSGSSSCGASSGSSWGSSCGSSCGGGGCGGGCGGCGS
jgi:uncharacterized protein (TIGR04222 family)